MIKTLLAALLLAGAALVPALIQAEATQTQERFMAMEREQYRQMLEGQGKSKAKIEEALREYDKKKELAKEEKNKKQKKTMRKESEAGGGEGPARNGGQDRTQNREKMQPGVRETRGEQVLKGAQSEPGGERSGDGLSGGAQGQCNAGSDKEPGTINRQKAISKSREGVSGGDNLQEHSGQAAREQRQQLHEAGDITKNLPAGERARARRMLGLAQRAMRGEKMTDVEMRELQGVIQNRVAGQMGGGHFFMNARAQSQAQTRAQTHEQTRLQPQTRSQAGPGQGSAGAKSGKGK